MDEAPEEVGKTVKVLRSLTANQKAEISTQMDELLKGDLKFIVDKYVRNYRNAVAATFGWTRDDLMQQVRISVWKGLATYDPVKKFKITTYISTILHHYFLSLAKKCRSAKNANSKLICVEEVSEPGREYDKLPLEERLPGSESLEQFIQKLTPVELEILKLLYVEHKKPAEVPKFLPLDKHQIAELTGSLKRKLRDHIQELEDEEDSI